MLEVAVEAGVIVCAGAGVADEGLIQADGNRRVAGEAVGIAGGKADGVHGGEGDIAGFILGVEGDFPDAVIGAEDGVADIVGEQCGRLAGLDVLILLGVAGEETQAGERALGNVVAGAEAEGGGLGGVTGDGGEVVVEADGLIVLDISAHDGHDLDGVADLADGVIDAFGVGAGALGVLDDDGIGLDAGAGEDDGAGVGKSFDVAEHFAGLGDGPVVGLVVGEAGGKIEAAQRDFLR